MDQQKAVVILLLITIILSVFSVVLTLSTSAGRTSIQKETITKEPPANGQISFQIVEAPSTGSAG